MLFILFGIHAYSMMDLFDDDEDDDEYGWLHSKTKAFLFFSIAM